jgi:RPA family protein
MPRAAGVDAFSADDAEENPQIVAEQVSVVDERRRNAWDIRRMDQRYLHVSSALSAGEEERNGLNTARR